MLEATKPRRAQAGLRGFLQLNTQLTQKLFVCRASCFVRPLQEARDEAGSLGTLASLMPLFSARGDFAVYDAVASVAQRH